MDRRDFLKLTAALTGAACAPTVLTAGEGSKKAVTVKPSTELKTDGFVQEPARRIPVVDSADVVVLGGGPAGVSAAISAARAGADVMLLERQYFLGGLWTGCYVLPVIDTHGLSQGGTWSKCIYGNTEKIIGRLRELGMCIDRSSHPVPDPEATKYVLEEFITANGVRLLYNCQGASLVMSGDRIDSIIVETKSGRLAIKAKMFVDCSGDGDLIEWAGEDFELRTHHIGAMWRVGNAPEIKRGSTPIKDVRNMHIGGEKNQDGLNVYNQTRLMLKYRKHMWDKAQEDKKTPGNENLYLLDSPSLLGVRITRVLNSQYNVRWDESLKYTAFEDCIGLSGGDPSLKYLNGTMKGNTRPIWQIPYRALVPKRVPNLLVAGRCFGFDKGMTYDAREVGTCLVTGQAAGSAAAIAVRDRCSVQKVKIDKLQEFLLSEGAKLSF